MRRSLHSFTFFYVLYKRTQKKAALFFGFISHTKIIESRKKKNVKERCCGGSVKSAERNPQHSYDVTLHIHIGGFIVQ